MSDRSGRDASGRPIVAELGRAETAEEAYERKQGARVARRANQTAFNLVVALIASLAIVAFLVIVVVRPDQQSALRPVDWKAAAEQAQGSTSARILVPDLGKGWVSNRAEYDARPADDVPTWSVGWITPDKQYAAMDQGIRGTDGWVVDVLDQKRATGGTRIAGREWTVYDHRDDDDPGNLAYALETTIGRSRVVLSGTASNAEFRELAAAVSESAGSGS